MRALVRETHLSPDALMLPLFVCEGEGVRREVSSMPGVFNLSVDEAVKEAAAARADGIRSVLLFGLPDHKDDVGSSAYDPEAPVQTAVRALKREVPDVLVVTDVCLCEYTDHGHCGLLIDDEIANDPTVDQLVRAAVSHAAAGADIVAPSDMMDGRVGAIRQALDERGHEQVAIMSYAAKYCSAFYGPFREAAGSAPKFGDRRSHQMDPANVREALREVEQDIAEGADLVMVKPAVRVPGRHPAGQGRVRLSDRGVSRERRVRDAEGGGTQRLDRRDARDARDAHLDPPRRRGHHHHLLRARRRSPARIAPFMATTTRSARLFARALQILPGGVDSPVRAFKSVGASPLFIERAIGRDARRRRRQHATSTTSCRGDRSFTVTRRAAWSRRSPRRRGSARATARPARSRCSSARRCGG